MTPFQIGLLGGGLMILLLATSMPVAFVMALVGVVGYAAVVSPAAAANVLARDFYEIFANYGLTVIPLFVLMGQVAFHAGISGRLFRAAYCWVGALPGGLAIAAVAACAGFGAICGSGPATAATMALVALPEMKRYGYNMELATGTVAAGGSLGMLIPPSVVFVVYGIMTEQSIGALFASGILPGTLCAVLFALAIYANCRRRPHLGPAAPPIPWREKWASLSGVLETLVLFVFVMGGMFCGFFTPTEAAAVGAAGSLVLALARRQLTGKLFRRCLWETARTSCMVLAIVAGATVFGHFLTITRIPIHLAAWLAGLPFPGWIVMSLMIVFYLLAGCFVDALALILLTIPVFHPVVLQLGYDPIWFGVIIVLVTQMGVITPPVGINVYVVAGIERDVPMQAVFKGALPFLLMLIVTTAILIAFPNIATWLPGLVRASGGG